MLALGCVVRLEADTLLGRPACQRRTGRVREGERLSQEDVRARALWIRVDHRRDNANFLVRGPRVDLDPVTRVEAVPIRCPDPGGSGLGRDGERSVDEEVGARLEAVGDHVALVPVLVGAVSGRGVEDVGDRSGALREDRRAPLLLDPVQDPVAGGEEIAAGLALLAATTCAVVLESAPVESVPRLTRMSLPLALTLSGEFASSRHPD
jgi:hypothetical protein